MLEQVQLEAKLFNHVVGEENGFRAWSDAIERFNNSEVMKKNWSFACFKYPTEHMKDFCSIDTKYAFARITHVELVDWNKALVTLERVEELRTDDILQSLKDMGSVLKPRAVITPNTSPVRIDIITFDTDLGADVVSRENYDAHLVNNTTLYAQGEE